VSGITLFAPLNGNGIRGTISWVQEGLGSKVTVLMSIESLFTEKREYSWDIHEFPVNYGEDPEARCHRSALGAP